MSEEKARPLEPHVWMPDMKTIDFEIIKRAAQHLVSKELLNSNIDIANDILTNHVIVRLTQRMLAKPSDEAVVTEEEKVPADWLSHLIVTITGSSVPRGHGWRWRLFRHAKFRVITTRSTFYRTCPHIAIAETNTHLRWMIAVNDDAALAHWQRDRE